MQRLVDGVLKFQQNVFPKMRARFEELAKGQHPHTLFITCSDSRIDPNLLTQTGPGELFVVRNAGNFVPRYGEANGGEAATIEYALAALADKLTDVVVCGHSHCGAMKAVVGGGAPSLPAVDSWLRHADETGRAVAQVPEAERTWAAIERNVLAQLENLKTHPKVADALGRKAIQLHGWVYRFETGEVLASDAGRERFAPLAGGGAASGKAP